MASSCGVASYPPQFGGLPVRCAVAMESWQRVSPGRATATPPRAWRSCSRPVSRLCPRILDPQHQITGDPPVEFGDQRPGQSVGRRLWNSTHASRSWNQVVSQREPSSRRRYAQVASASSARTDDGDKGLGEHHRLSDVTGEVRNRGASTSRRHSSASES